MFATFLSRLCALAHLWFDDFRWKEFFGYMSAVYAFALVFAGQVQVPVAYHQVLAVAFTIIAGFMYVLNPKCRNWEAPAPTNTAVVAPVTVEPGSDPLSTDDGGHSHV